MYSVEVDKEQGDKSEIRSLTTGNKCKFSHDLNVGRKVEKVNLYADVREDKQKGESSQVTHSWGICSPFQARCRMGLC